jgi:hypothetical protein
MLYFSYPENGNNIVISLMTLEEISMSQALVAHACNPSHSGDRDQEDCGSKPARANSSRDSILKIPNTGLAE